LFLLLVVLLGIGTAFYTAVEGWSVVDSLYFCVSTLSTVGFGDLTPTKDESKLFTIVFLLIGVGVFVGIAGKLGRELLREPTRPVRDETDEAPN
jgi:voltage-gated potassium channel